MIHYIFDYLIPWMKLSIAPAGESLNLRLKVLKVFIN